MTTDDAPVAERVDPRITRSRQVVRQAALDELAAVGYGALRVEAVARRAGVGKSTIYRLWGDKLALVADALETLNRQPGPATVDGTPREQLTAVLRHLAEAMRDSTLGRCVPALVEAAEQDATVRTFFHEYARQRRQTVVRILAAGVASGDFRADLDPEQAALALAGAVFYRRLITPEPFGPDEVPALLASVLGPA